jgi:sec-independent protein translocase protein TatB
MFPEGRILDFLLVGVIALIVVGPKDLPVLMRRVGEFVGKMRAMAAEFRASFDEMARQSELEELRKEVEAMRVGQGGPAAAARSALGLGTETPAGQVFEDINTGLAGGAAALHPPTGYGYPASFEAGPESGSEAGSGLGSEVDSAAGRDADSAASPGASSGPARHEPSAAESLEHAAETPVAAKASP